MVAGVVASLNVRLTLNVDLTNTATLIRNLLYVSPKRASTLEIALVQVGPAQMDSARKSDQMISLALLYQFIKLINSSIFHYS